MKQETTDDRPEVTHNAHQTSEGARRPYDSPKLTAYGSLVDLTGGVGNVGTDGVLGSKQSA